MIDRARDIAKTMGYDDIDAILEAIGKGELILFKIAEGRRIKTAEWLRDLGQRVRFGLWAAGVLPAPHGPRPDDIVRGLELASELAHYPLGAEVCDIDLPHGWPSYCEPRLLE